MGYEFYELRISGYNDISTKTWYGPRACVIASSNPNIIFDVRFGNISDNKLVLYIAPVYNYPAVVITDFVRSYNTPRHATLSDAEIFTISLVSDISGTIRTTMNPRPPFYKTETIPIENGGTKATTAQGARINLSVPMAEVKSDIWGIGTPATCENSWLRSPSAGFLPYASGGESSSLGTNEWPFHDLWVKYPRIKENAKVGFGKTYCAYIEGGDKAYFSCRDTSDVNRNNLVIYPDRTETQNLGAIVCSTWSSENIRYIKYASDSYMHVNSKNHGNWGISWWASDIRMKTDIEDTTQSALDLINQIEHKSFTMNPTGKSYDIGYIAQELEEIDPRLVIKVPQYRQVDRNQVFTGDYTYQIDERMLIPYATKAIQELDAKVTDLEARIKKLEEKVMNHGDVDQG